MPLKNLAVDPTTGDLLKKGNNFQKVLDLKAVAQNINTYLQTNTTEIYIDEDLGIPWIQVMTRKNIDLDFKNSIIKEAVMSRPFVEAITRYETRYISDGFSRILEITMNIKVGTEIIPVTSNFLQEA